MELYTLVEKRYLIAVV